MPGPSGRRGSPDRAFGRLPGMGPSRPSGSPSPPQGPGRGGPGAGRGDPRGQGQVRHCTTCFHLTEAENPLCAICRDPRRDPGLVCVVEQPRDLLALEKAGTSAGSTTSCSAGSPRAGGRPRAIDPRCPGAPGPRGGVRELIMATNPTLEGDGTALLVAERLADSACRSPGSPAAWPRAASGIRQQRDARRRAQRPPAILIASACGAAGCGRIFGCRRPWYELC